MLQEKYLICTLRRSSGSS